MRMLTPDFLRAFPHRVLNIHPAILPSFPGVHGMPDALAWGVKLSGCTVHFVDEAMDHGSVIIQAAVRVSAEDTEETLAARVHEQEHRIYPQALQWLAEDRLFFVENSRTVGLRPASRALAAVQGGVLISPALEAGF